MFYTDLIKLPSARVATGLYSHWDSIIKVDKEVLKWIRKSEDKKPRKNVLSSIDEVIFSLKKSLKNGDMESLISKSTYDYLKRVFPKRERRLGGNGFNMGKALFELGLRPLVSFPTRSECLMSSCPDLKVATKYGLKSPIEAIRKKDPDYDHIVFESSKWRNILSWDQLSSNGVFDDDFLNFALDPKRTDVAVISYAHLLLPRYRKRTDYLLELIKKNRPSIHLEFGLGSEKSMSYAMNRFSENGACDSFGMNERECRIYLKVKSDEMKDLTEASIISVKEYNVKRICVHSSKFAFSVSRYDIKKEEESLMAGCIAAGLKFSDTPKIGKIVVKKRKVDGFGVCSITGFYNPLSEKITGLGDVFSSVQAVKSLF